MPEHTPQTLDSTVTASILRDDVVEVVERRGRIAEGAEDVGDDLPWRSSRTHAIGNASDCARGMNSSQKQKEVRA